MQKKEDSEEPEGLEAIGEVKVHDDKEGKERINSGADTLRVWRGGRRAARVEASGRWEGYESECKERNRAAAGEALEGAIEAAVADRAEERDGQPVPQHQLLREAGGGQPRKQEGAEEQREEDAGD